MLKADDPPIGMIFSMIARSYAGVFTKQLEGLPIERYFYVLVLVHEAEGKVTQKDLAEQLMTDKVSVLRMVDHLSDKDLLVRERDPEDRRAYQLRLTAEGKALIPRIREGIRTANEICLQGFSDEERSQLEDLLSRMACTLSNTPGDEFRVHFSKVDDDE
jgi:MarR family transcriptional regulator for hemolysin